MTQFALYKNEDSASNTTYPYFVDVQNSLLADLNSRLVIPLTPHSALGNTDVKRLCPVFHFDEGDFVLLTHQMTSAPKSILKTEAGSLAEFRYEILTAIDMLISGI
ncbi:plasmid maintenance protein CcdB [Candidatus Tenderia electrophaga]|jgi:toxin CcdB|uniref:Toxin CcdB n=1 Tax=Candidatus Tenderia electrophaga TaxID=1748243 RepID=A0A0S2TF90_9GAMM|nr:plasmid maintenance protein CcdB [Candidatus Tenderia electrophaga]